MSDSAFQKVLKAPPGSTPDTSKARVAAPDRIPFTSSSAPRTLAQAVQSVVLVQTNDGHGSGFLISPEGYVLTNHHVVGTARTVRVRWADGTEGPAQVLRSDRQRDIALLKVDRLPPSQALALHAALPSQGDVAFAIGAPLDPSLQGTLTRGVISANRVMNGLSFIQSDVSVTHGNSGGPLLNARGEVLGITDLGLPTDDGQDAKLNMFIPIADALRVLALTPSAVRTAVEPAPLARRKASKR